MRNYLIILALAFAILSAACGGEETPATPVETFKTYIKAIKKKDTNAMRVLLSAETLKTHEQDAKAQGVTVDDIIKRDTLFSDGQRSIEYRNEKIDGEKATLHVKDPYDRWQTIHFVLENGEWKIDKKASADQLLQEIEEKNRQADENYNMNRPVEASPAMPVEPITPANSNGFQQ
ncbi:MAG: hypothetical protein ACRD6X_05115 [Pyrinomonadaceae bacterium]